MKKISIQFIPLYFLLCFFPKISQAQETERLYLSGIDAANTVNWEFYCSDGRKSKKWTYIPVPSVWEQEGFGSYNYGHDWKNEEPAKEIGFYRHRFQVPAQWKGKHVQIVFDGAMTDTEVKINGQVAGEKHQGAFYRFSYDISDKLEYGKENLLEVCVWKHSENASVNAAERQADFWIFGGIFRPVFLEVKPENHMVRTALDPQADGSLKMLIELNTEAQNKYELEVQLLKAGEALAPIFSKALAEGKKTQEIQCKFEDIIPWNPENPQLYDLQLSLKKKKKTIHQKTERIGFRTVELREHDGIYVNDRKVVFKGVNRHSFRPETGRCLSYEDHLEDIRLIKEMNMNAVRMSHYVPDKRFLELCDSIGLFVLNELTGWQDAYDTLVGPKLIKELILKDENHPSVVIWNHGNEGGWDYSSEKYFHHYDIQKRPILYPWLLRNGVDSRHYPIYNYAIARFLHGNVPFMPLEFMHGLYDGGHGAGLDAYWSLYQSSPLHAGGFLWAFSDEAVLRTDMDSTFYDSDGNHAPDGILGPNHEKEGSFYTIKEIWSPVQIAAQKLNKKWNGELLIQNKYIYTNLNTCSFEWECVKTNPWKLEESLVGKGKLVGPDAEPGETRKLKIACHLALQEADIFRIKAIDKEGQELYTWTWPLIEADEQSKATNDSDPVAVQLSGNDSLLIIAVKDFNFSFSKKTGNLEKVQRNDELIGLSGGIVPAGIPMKTKSVEAIKDPDGNVLIKVQLEKGFIHWTILPDARIKYEAHLLNQGVKAESINNQTFAGISFNYPEEKVKGIKWLGDGPYRVWKNRLKGVEFGLWQKDYNNTLTGESFTDLVYPEFKGYHANLFWMELETEECPINIQTETPHLYFNLYRPQKPNFVRGGSYAIFPEGDLSFLYEIPPIGTKFKKAEQMGPSGQKGSSGARRDDEYPPIILWISFESMQLK